MRSIIPALGSIIASICCLAGHSEATTFEPLTPYSEYECIRFEDGGVSIARVTAAGRQIVSAKQVESLLKSKGANLAATRRKLKEMKRDLAAEGLSNKDLRSLKGLLDAAFQDPVSDVVRQFGGKKPNFRTRKEKKMIIEALIDDAETDILGIQLEQSALTACLGGPPPAVTGIPVRLVPFNEYGNHYMILVVADLKPKRPAKTGYAYSYCVKRDGKAYPIYFSFDPCSLVSGQTRYGSCPYAAIGAPLITGIIATSSQGSADTPQEVERLLISAYATWKNKTIEAKVGGQSTDCYALFK